MTKHNNQRPMSPHLSIYKPQLTSMLSIFHRATGALLSCIFFAIFLLLQLNTEIGIELNNVSVTSYAWLIKSIGFCSIVAMNYHAFNGIRHLLWDFGFGLDLRSLYSTGYLVLILSLLSSIFIWTSI